MVSCRATLCCESPDDERSAGNRHATFCRSRARLAAPGDPVRLETERVTRTEAPAMPVNCYSPRVTPVPRQSSTLHVHIGQKRLSYPVDVSRHVSGLCLPGLSRQALGQVSFRTAATSAERTV